MGPLVRAVARAVLVATALLLVQLGAAVAAVKSVNGLSTETNLPEAQRGVAFSYHTLRGTARLGF